LQVNKIDHIYVLNILVIIYFAENDYIDDALFGALMLLKYMKKGVDINNLNIPRIYMVGKRYTKK